MIEGERAWVDIAQRLDPVEKAVASAKRAGAAKAIEEFRAISRDL